MGTGVRVVIGCARYSYNTVLNNLMSGLIKG